MKKRFLLISALVFTLLTSACNKENLNISQEEASNGLKVRVKADGEFTTKSEDLVDVNDFIIAIKNGEEIIKSWDKLSEMPSVVSLDAGDYSLSASSPETLPVAFSQPIYQGSKNFNIVAGKITSIDLICSLTNMKVSVIPSENFYKEIMDDFSIIVTSEYGMLNFNSEITKADISGYFTVVPKLEVSIQGKRKSDETQLINHHYTITGCKAKDHHVLRIDAVSTGDVTIGEDGIVIDYTVNNKEVDIIIDGWDEEPVDPEPDPDPVVPITISAPGVDEMLVLTDADAANAQIDINVKADEGIKELWVDIQSEYLKGMMSEIGQPSRFNLADLSDPSLREFIEGLGLVANGEVSGAKTYSFSIGSFMPLIESGIENPIHPFVITVKDMKDNVKEIKMVIKRIA